MSETPYNREYLTMSKPTATETEKHIVMLERFASWYVLEGQDSASMSQKERIKYLLKKMGIK